MTIERIQPVSPLTRGARYFAVSLGILLSLVPAAVRGYVDDFDGGPFFPLFWISGALVVLPILLILDSFVMRPLRTVRYLTPSFIISTVILFILGFSWTGDWIRFVAFEAGFAHLQLVRPRIPTTETLYHWRAWGIAGLENDSYLVTDRSGEIAVLPAGSTIKGSACPIADNRPMIPPWRLVTTFECNLFGP